MIEFKDIHKKFGKQQVLHGIDLKFDQAGIFAILGPNGSGKTTLIKSLMGMVHPTAGEILIDGKVKKGNDYRKNIAYLPQIARFPENLTVEEFLDFIENIRGKAERKFQLMECFGVEVFYKKKLRTLSGGMRQKVNLVSALMYDTQTIVLDEPTIGLDPVALIALKDWLRMEQAAGKTILLTTHIMDIVQELADEIVFLLDGKVYYRGTQQELLTKTGAPNTEHAIAQLLTLKKAA
ncbi:ABC-type multidrug transport system, ATPase component [Owenweeksia hongkongensis DSM 17368]|uniref:ABC-type multidrug transport system, ATPase component n=1 Tax=Owenweeksia hongkongensis (strain DSM 17368 / CIP 108786 / JCM 12287 / NRRL B-23963 / UST20020801) TaxID=926562 RepID=G8R6E5_OWEHD|nr:ATP-binding cassette domain-containing protein [Owenweeksia hongkongensis]AEV34408.1 ABC-type multidrug transport system, ATPase component [Owenweeksia hongkongensis DSM 17368]